MHKIISNLTRRGALGALVALTATPAIAHVPSADRANALWAERQIQGERLARLSVEYDAAAAKLPEWAKSGFDRIDADGNTRRAKPLSDEAKAKIIRAVDAGATMSQLAHGKLPGGKRTRSLAPHKNIMFTRQLDPEFNAFLSSRLPVNTQKSRSRSFVIRHTRAQTSAARQEANDYHAILDMIPSGNPHRDDIVARIFEDMLGGTLRRMCPAGSRSMSQSSTGCIRPNMPNLETGSSSRWMK